MKLEGFPLLCVSLVLMSRCRPPMSSCFLFMWVSTCWDHIVTLIAKTTFQNTHSNNFYPTLIGFSSESTKKSIKAQNVGEKLWYWGLHIKVGSQIASIFMFMSVCVLSCMFCCVVLCMFPCGYLYVHSFTPCLCMNLLVTTSVGGLRLYYMIVQ